MKDAVVIVGGGGHAKVILDILEVSGTVEIAGFVTREGSGDFCGHPVLGNDSALDGIHKKGVLNAIVAVGENRRRADLMRLVESYGFRLWNAISPHACVSRRAQVGSGVAIMPGAVVNAGSRIDDGAILNTNCAVDHDCRIHRYVHIGPGATLAGGVVIEEGAFLGTGASVTPNVIIGSWACVGAGAVALKNLPSGVTAIGIPAKPIATGRNPTLAEQKP